MTEGYKALRYASNFARTFSFDDGSLAGRPVAAKLCTGEMPQVLTRQRATGRTE